MLREAQKISRPLPLISGEVPRFHGGSLWHVSPVLGNGSNWETITVFARLSVFNMAHISVQYLGVPIFSVSISCNLASKIHKEDRVSILAGAEVRELPQFFVGKVLVRAICFEYQISASVVLVSTSQV